MVLFLFYSYLNYQKEHNPSIMKRLQRLPVRLWGFFAVVFLSIVFAIFFLLKGSLVPALCAVVVEIVFCEISNRQIELFNIKHSDNSLEEHWEDCRGLKQWLEDNGVSDCDSIQEIVKRTEDCIDELKTEIKTDNDRIDKLFHALLIPIVLAFIYHIINQESVFSEKIVFTGAVLVIFLLVLYIFEWFKNIHHVSKKRDIERMRNFSMDLRGVLDLDRFQIKKNKEVNQ